MVRDVGVGVWKPLERGLADPDRARQIRASLTQIGPDRGITSYIRYKAHLDDRVAGPLRTGEVDHDAFVGLQQEAEAVLLPPQLARGAALGAVCVCGGGDTTPAKPPHVSLHAQLRMLCASPDTRHTP